MTKYQNEIKTLLAGTNRYKGAYIAGGAITSVFTRQPINDYDYYFKSERDFQRAVAGAYDDGLWCVDASKRAVTFASGHDVYQFMHFGFFPEASDIFASFDFTACMAAYDFDTQELMMHDDFLTHCSQRFLRFNPGTRYPLASAVRVLKYQDRGYSIGKGDITRIALACRKVEINTWEQLKDQIGGAYGDKVMLNAEGDFSLDAAIAALDPDTIWTNREAKDQPAFADDLLRKIADLKGVEYVDLIGTAE